MHKNQEASRHTNWIQQYSLPFILCHFDHLRRLMFTKTLNRETCNFLASKKKQFTSDKVYFVSLLSFCCQFEELLWSHSDKADKRESRLYTFFYYCIKYIYSIRAEYWCFVKVQVHLIFALQSFQVYSQKFSQKCCEWDNSLNFFVWKFEIL